MSTNKDVLKWFSLDGPNSDQEGFTALMNMFSFVKKSLHIYFSIEDSINIQDLFIKVLNKKDSDIDFLFWIINKGMVRLRSIDYYLIPNNTSFITFLEIEKHCLENELNLKDLEEVRSCIISFINNIPVKYYWYLRN